MHSWTSWRLSSHGGSRFPGLGFGCILFYQNPIMQMRQKTRTPLRYAWEWVRSPAWKPENPDRIRVRCVCVCQFRAMQSVDSLPPPSWPTHRIQMKGRMPHHSNVVVVIVDNDAVSSHSSLRCCARLPIHSSVLWCTKGQNGINLYKIYHSRFWFGDWRMLLFCFVFGKTKQSRRFQSAAPGWGFSNLECNWSLQCGRSLWADNREQMLHRRWWWGRMKIRCVALFRIFDSG